jgi:hypothetical protein
MIKKMLSLIGVMSVLVFAVLLIVDFKGVTVLDKYSPFYQERISSDGRLKSLFESTLRVDSGIKTNTRESIKLSELGHPVLFVVYKSIPYMGTSRQYNSYYEKQDDRYNKGRSLGLKYLLSIASDEWVSKNKHFFVLDVNSGPNMIQSDFPTKMMLTPRKGMSARLPYYAYLESDGAASNELRELLAYQDSLNGINGENPQNIALLAYYPELSEFVLLDDSRFEYQVLLDFYFGFDVEIAEDLASRYAELTNDLRARFSSIPNSAYLNVTPEDRIHDLANKVKQITKDHAGSIQKESYEILKDMAD